MIIWKTHHRQVTTASVRYRCLYPMRFLHSRGITSSFYSGREAFAFDQKDKSIVFVKAFRSHDLRMAKRAKEKGLQIYLDLCDDIFNEGYEKDQNKPLRSNFIEMAKLADGIITTGEMLHDRILENIVSPVEVHVIEDVVENRDDLSFARGIEAQWLRAGRKWSVTFNALMNRLGLTNRFSHVPVNIEEQYPAMASAPLDFDPKVKKLVWFGHHGNPPNAGMSALCQLKEALVTIAKEYPIQLIVISNNENKFQEIIVPMGIDAKYLEWNMSTIHDHVSQCDVAVLPSVKDEYNMCKSSNRALFALSQGIPVIATELPNLSELRDSMLFDDWSDGLRCYLRDDDLKTKHLAAFEKIKHDFSHETLGQKWHDLLTRR